MEFSHYNEYGVSISRVNVKPMELCKVNLVGNSPIANWRHSRFQSLTKRDATLLVRDMLFLGDLPHSNCNSINLNISIIDHWWLVPRLDVSTKFAVD